MNFQLTFRNVHFNFSFQFLRFENSNCSELLWRLARVVCEKGKLSKDQNQRKELILEAYGIVKKALDNEPKNGCFGAHKWYDLELKRYLFRVEQHNFARKKNYD